MRKIGKQDNGRYFAQSLLRGSVQPAQVASMLNVYPANGLSGDTLAERIKHAGIADLKVTSPTEAKQQFEQFSMTFNLIVMGSALIALIVGALSVINTMAMSVAEQHARPTSTDPFALPSPDLVEMAG